MGVEKWPEKLFNNKIEKQREKKEIIYYCISVIFIYIYSN